MRFKNKYKHYNVLNFYKDSTHRILKFKRPKWKKLQVLIKAKKKQKFINNLIKYSSFKSFERIGNSYKNGLQASRLLSLIFQVKSKSLLQLNKPLKKFSKKSLINSILLNPLFVLKILLWKLKIFKSSFEAAHKIDSGFVLVNGCCKSNNYVLKKGDIISFDNLNFNLSIDNQILNTNLFFSFLEFDLYTGTFVVVKESNTFSDSEYSLISEEYLDIKTLADYNSK